MNPRITLVLDLLAAEGRLTLSPEDFADFLQWKDKGSSYGAAMMRGTLIERNPLAMTMLFDCLQTNPELTEAELWARGRAALEQREAARRKLEEDVAREQAQRQRAVDEAAAVLKQAGKRR